MLSSMCMQCLATVSHEKALADHKSDNNKSTNNTTNFIRQKQKQSNRIENNQINTSDRLPYQEQEQEQRWWPLGQKLAKSAKRGPSVITDQ